jgi:hypothetical protein
VARDNRDEDVVIPDPNGVPVRLAELGLTVELLVEAIRRGQEAADYCTRSHPVFYPGVVAYCETNGALREECALLGWSLNDEDNIARTVSPDGAVVITAVSGNERTGLRTGEHAQTKRPRGQAGLRIVRRNSQLELQELLPAAEQLAADSDAVELGSTWFLLYYRDGSVVRSELSRARSIMLTSRSSTLLAWAERLPLPEIDLDEPHDDNRFDRGDNPDVDVPVRLRSA